MIEPIYKFFTQKEDLCRLLNTLSLMELQGARKLASLVPDFGHHTFFLEHVAEEFRHAYFLRIQAEKIAKKKIESFAIPNIFAPKESRNYIINIHRNICLTLKKNKLSDAKNIKWRAYILSTLVIEKRALAFYQQCQEALEQASVALSVKSIISEEHKHLSEILGFVQKDQELSPKIINECHQIEEKLFDKWLKTVAK